MSKNNEVKGIVVKFKGKNIIVTKDKMQVLGGIALIVLSLIMSGFFAFVSVGFDVSRLATFEFWLSYCITLCTMYIGFFGVYVIRETRNKQQPKIVINNKLRRDFRDMIIKNRKLESCENWLKIYNYGQRVQIHKDNLTEMYRKLKPITVDSSLDKNSKKYKKMEHKRTIYEAKKAYLKKQLEYANLHEEVVALLKLGKFEEAKLKKAGLGDDDSFKCAKIIWREIYFNDLFNGSMRHNSNSIFYNKRRAIWDNIKLALVLSVCGTMITTSMILMGNEVNIYTALTIIANVAMLCCYAVMAIRVADNVVFETVYPADENKLTICNLFKEDDEKVNTEWEDIEEDEETEAENDDDQQEVANEKDDI